MKILLLVAVCLCTEMKAQNATSADLVEGGKVMVELIRVFKTPKTAMLVTANNNTDSCGLKKLGDISFKNKTGKMIQVSLYLRIGNAYELKPLLLNISTSSRETLYDIKSGIYKYKVETEVDGVKITLHEGELKLQSCEKLQKEIKN